MTASSGHAWNRSYEPNRNLITSVTNSFNGNLISAFDYANDEIGRRTARLDSQLAGVATTNAFGYNTRSEVTHANMGTNTYGYVFDPIGNRITATNNADVTSYAANALNQYTDITNTVAAQPVHDADGNVLMTGDGWNYTWNGENRLILASNKTALVSYTYDHQGRMVWKTAASSNMLPTTSINYLWDGYNIIAETVSTNSTTNTTYNVWGLNIDSSLQGVGGVSGLLTIINTNGIFVPAYDANGNVTEYTDANGVILAAREYDPFGGTITASGNANAFTHWFSTKPFCPVIGLYEYQFRMYSPKLGRWTSRDLIQESGGINLCVFAMNDGVNRNDNLGLQTTCPTPCPKGVKTRAAGNGCSEWRTGQQGAAPSSNGCGSKDGIKFPDYPLICGGRIPFVDCCNPHDECYSTCGSDKRNCDDVFGACLYDLCAKLENLYDRVICHTLKELYYIGVSAGGDGAYGKGQDGHCRWDLCCESN